ncbi:hypothetical protein V6V89_08035 [Micromonospora sp. CPCC 206061]
MRATSNGFRGTSDGWTDLRDGRLDHQYRAAAAGNLVRTARLRFSSKGRARSASDPKPVRAAHCPRVARGPIPRRFQGIRGQLAPPSRWLDGTTRHRPRLHRPASRARGARATTEVEWSGLWRRVRVEGHAGASRRQVAAVSSSRSTGRCLGICGLNPMGCRVRVRPRRQRQLSVQGDFGAVSLGAAARSPC